MYRTALVNAVHDTVVILAADPTPKDKDVKAGWVGFGVFLGLCAVVALLCWAFYRQMKRVKSAADAGVYGENLSPEGAELTETPDAGQDPHGA